MTKLIKVFVLFCLTTNYTPCYSQDLTMDKEVQEVIQLGKDSIVQMGLQLLDEKASIQNFAKIKVMTDGNEVYVSLRNPIKYLPLESAFCFDALVSIIGKTISYNPVVNGITDNESSIPFYKQTEETASSIKFVTESINKSDVAGPFDAANFEDDMIIFEKEKYYAVSIVSEGQESSYKIEKGSGKVYDAEHAHLAPPPMESENKAVFKEIH